MNDLDSIPQDSEAALSQPIGKNPLYAIVDIAVWLWPRRRLLVAELRAARAPTKVRKRPGQRLRFAA
ncbi:MAG TPA: hypothetical protein VK034_19730 [Enhygromyxa sp.]|nr:hypothetical protein [Enhygromyxa sp.]